LLFTPMADTPYKLGAMNFSHVPTGLDREVAMIRITFTEETVALLRYERFHHPHPRVQKKMEALLLKSEGLGHEEICRIVGITANTLRTYLREFLAGGVEALKAFRISHSQGAWDSHRTTLEAYFREHPPATVKEAAVKIEELTGIRRSETQVRKFLKSLGMRRLKVGYTPAKADPEEQERFKKRRTRSPARRGARRPPRGAVR